MTLNIRHIIGALGAAYVASALHAWSGTTGPTPIDWWLKLAALAVGSITIAFGPEVVLHLVERLIGLLGNKLAATAVVPPAVPAPVEPATPASVSAVDDVHPDIAAIFDTVPAPISPKDAQSLQQQTSAQEALRQTQLLLELANEAKGDKAIIDGIKDIHKMLADKNFDKIGGVK